MRTGVRSRRIGIGAVARLGSKQFRANAQRLIGRMAHAKHPLIAAHRAHAAAHLVGQRLKGEPVIGRRQRAGNGIARRHRAVAMREKFVNGFLESGVATSVRSRGTESARAGSTPALRGI